MRQVAALFAGVALAAAGAGPAPASSCDSQPQFHALDFWIGRWRVVDPSGALQGFNVVRKIEAGCALLEEWREPDGSTGTSFFWVEPASRAWRQVWITDRALAIAGTKEKRQVQAADVAPGAVRMQGERAGRDGRRVLDRTTLTPLPDGTVRQWIQVSRDGGATWDDGWIGIYSPDATAVTR